MSQAHPKKRSPIKTPPPRQAGESLRVLQDEFIDRNIMLWVYAATAGVIAAGLVWAMMLVGYTMLETAWILTLAAAGNCIYAAFRFYKARHQLRAFRLGLEGERTVGALLEDLRRSGYRILHDIPNARKPAFNIDHVAVGPGGVFAIETKTYSKAGTRSEKIRVVDGRLIIPGLDTAAYGSDPLTQAAASADFIRDHLAQTTHHKVFVRPVLVFPGWYVEEPSAAMRDTQAVWVLNEKRLFEWIGNSPQRLTKADVALYAQRLRLHADECAG